MALCLGVRPGMKLRFGTTEVRVMKVDRTADPTLITLRVNGGGDYFVSELERVEILPGVFVSGGGMHPHYPQTERLVCEAPRSIRIERVRG